MGKYITIALFVLLNTTLFAQHIRPNKDVETIKQVVANTTTAVTTESVHTAKLDSIGQQKKKMSAAKTAFYTLKKSYHQAKRRSKEFSDLKNPYVKQIGKLSVKIVRNLPIAINELYKSKQNLKTSTAKYLYALNELANLGLKANSLIITFTNICANSSPQKFNFKLVADSPVDSKSDGYNLLSRHERMKLTQDILLQLHKIDAQLDNMILMFRYCNTINGYMFELSPDLWLNQLIIHDLTDRIIYDMKNY